MNDDIYPVLISAKNQISEKPMINSEMLNVRSVIGAGLHHIVTIVSDETCAGNSLMKYIRNSVREILKKLSKYNKIDISIISVSQSQIKLKNDFQEYEDVVFDYESEQKGLSPILSAVYVAHLRNVKLKMLYDNDDEKECGTPFIIIISDFMDNDNRYDGVSDSIMNDMLSRINNGSKEKIIKIILECQHPNNKEHFSEKLSGDCFYMKRDNPESVFYWLEKKMYSTVADNSSDDAADDPFNYNIRTKMNNIYNISESDFKNKFGNGNICLSSDKQPFMPIIIAVDASLSMKQYAEYVTDCFKKIFSERMDFVDLAIMAVYDSDVKTIRNFSSENPMTDTLTAQISAFMNNAKGISPLVFFLDIAYRKLIGRIGQYKEKNINFVSPMLIVISDFLPNDFGKTNCFSEISDIFGKIENIARNKDITSVRVRIAGSDELSVKWNDAFECFSADVSSDALSSFIVQSYKENTKSVKSYEKNVSSSDISELLKEVRL